MAKASNKTRTKSSLFRRKLQKMKNLKAKPLLTKATWVPRVSARNNILTENSSHTPLPHKATRVIRVKRNILTERRNNPGHAVLPPKATRWVKVPR